MENIEHAEHLHIASACVFCGSTDIHRSTALLMPFVAHRALGWEPADITPDWELRDIGTGKAFSICNTLYCNNCGGMFLDLRFGTAEMQRLYDDYRGTAYVALRETYEPGYSQRNTQLNATSHRGWVEDFLAPFVGDSPRVLDWGGYDGRNTPFRDKGSVCHLFDIANVQVVDGVKSVSEEEALTQQYDVIVLSQVLEHLPDPAALLKKLAACPGEAKIYIEVPFEALMQTLDGLPKTIAHATKKRHWHEHINFFSADALYQLANFVGLTVQCLERRNNSDGSKTLTMLCQKQPSLSA